MDMKPAIDSIFVYGTLQPGEVNERYFDRFDGVWTSGYVLGSLENKGWGSEHGFPGIKLDDHGDRVTGSLFTTADIDEILVLLDELEGADYRRVVTVVYLENNTEQLAFIYELA